MVSDYGLRDTFALYDLRWAIYVTPICVLGIWTVLYVFGVLKSQLSKGAGQHITPVINDAGAVT